nr:BREX-1 system adenine-specific DNA-methyltransferase PglX [uncultured Niameybacter sp.]
MNKTAIKNFAIWARNKLIKEITYKAGLVGVTEKGIADALLQSTKDMQWFDIGTSEPSSIQGDAIKQREKLVQRIREKEKDSDYKTAYTSIVEEVAYTWFNRLIAIRFMEVNDYLPSRVRVLSSETAGKEEPDLVTSPFESDLEFTSTEADLIMQYKDTNQLDELFRMLFIKQCNKLNEILPKLFEKTKDYTELLLNISYTDKDGIVSHLVNDIEEEDFKEAVEIIGWLYQYYNTEPKEQVFLNLKKNIKISKENIPAATQLFTPDWIVKYMVENSIGRLWVEGHPNDDLKSGWKYYLEEAEQEEDVQLELEKIRAERKQTVIEDIKVIDPAMGSGHILVYVFDVLMQIYESQGYTQRDAAQSIVENNLFGLDIDGRAYQLAYFAVMMKARQYDRRFLTRKITPQLYCPKGYGEGEQLGSLLNVDKLESKPQTPEELTVFNLDWEKDINIWNFRRLLNQKYDVVITNPPYMGSSGMNTKLSDYIKNNYPDSKSDLFSAFIEKGNSMTKRAGYNCMVTMQSWMFLSSFEKMREKILRTMDISNLMHMENMVMGIAFGTAVTVFRKGNVKGYKGTYNHITMKDIDKNGMPIEFPVKENRFAQVSTENFSKIPGLPIAYWVSENFIQAFERGEMLGTKAISRNGMKTGENERFVRQWFEINNTKFKYDAQTYIEALESKAKWFPYNKGGEYRKWFGNNDYVVNWENEGQEVIKNAKADKRNVQDYPLELKFSPSASWGLISSGQPSFRYKQYNISDIAGMSFYANKEDVLYYLAFCNTKIANQMLQILAPTINYQAGDIGRLPLYVVSDKYRYIIDIVEQNIAISKTDWDSFESSWDFITHPLITYRSGAGYENSLVEQWQYRISHAFKSWESNAEAQFNTLKANEEELNRIFIDIYGLQEELTSEVEEKDVTVRKADLTRDIKSFISYAVGCMFGRYSLDREGLAYAGGDWDESKYTSFIPDGDNIILITEDEYFTDDIVNRFVEFVKVVYGEETLEENLDFIANALGNKGNTSREVIRNYFIKDFYKDHCKIYQKRPIYWLFDSGKQNGFKALIYMHRYNADTIGNLRIDYLHRLQKVYESEIARMQDIVDNSNNAKESTAAAKCRDKLVKQLQETKDYDQKIAHLALARTEIDLDDGVKVNYEKVQTGTDGKKLEVLAKI